jgi:hypothetical protein
MTQPVRPQPVHQELFGFQPLWWWDPVPPWVLHDLGRDVLVDLGRIQAELHVNVLRHQLEAAERSLEVLQKVK